MAKTTYQDRRKGYVGDRKPDHTEEDLGVEVYYSSYENGRLGATAFSGKRGKPDIHNIYQDHWGKTAEEHRTAHVERWLKGLREHKAYKEEQKAAKAGHTTTLQVGDILVGSWGYNQTNQSWYQVTWVSKTGKSVRIRRIASNDAGEGYSSHVVAAKDCFIEREPEMMKRVQIWVNGDNEVSESVTIESYLSVSKWNGKPRWVTPPNCGH